MCLNYEKINTFLEPTEKFRLYKRKNRSLLVTNIENLYIKPELASSFNLYDIFLFKNIFFANYLLEKLELLNKIQYISYIKLLNSIKNIKNFNYIINDYKLYNILWHNKFIEVDLDLFTPIQLISLFEFFLLPLVYKKKNEIFINDTNKNTKSFTNKTKNKKELNEKYDYMAFLELNEKDVKHSFYNTLENEKTIFDCDIMIEDFLSIHINFNNNIYSYINIKDYNDFLTNLNLSFKEKQFYLHLSTQHNLFVQNLNLSFISYATFNTNLIKKVDNNNNLTLSKIKKYEFKKSLTEFNTYIEYSFKTVKNFIEIFLFKFEFIFSISLDKILTLFYNGISSQIIFFDFYNLVINEFNKLKTEMNLYTLQFILEFLEFLSVICDVSNFNFLFFNQSIFNLVNNNYFKNLKIFRFNFWTRLKFFSFNNQILYYNYMFFTENYSRLKFYKYLFKNFDITQINNNLHNNDKSLLNLKNLKNLIKGIDVNKNLYYIYVIINFFQKFKYNLQLLHKIQKKKKLFKKKKKIFNFKIYIIFVNNYLKNLKNSLSMKISLWVLDNKILFNFKTLIYINILKVKDIIMYKNYKKKLLPKTSQNELFYMLDIFKCEIKNIFLKINILRLKFFKEIILYNKNRSSNLIEFKYINLLNIAMGIIPKKHDFIILNILRLFTWDLKLFLEGLNLYNPKSKSNNKKKC